jgi:hypothetical protein
MAVVYEMTSYWHASSGTSSSVLYGWELIVDNISFATHVFETEVKRAARSASSSTVSGMRMNA